MEKGSSTDGVTENLSSSDASLLRSVSSSSVLLIGGTHASGAFCPKNNHIKRISAAVSGKASKRRERLRGGGVFFLTGCKAYLFLRRISTGIAAAPTKRGSRMISMTGSQGLLTDISGRTSCRGAMSRPMLSRGLR